MIEAKLHQQSQELNNRTKIIEELKVSLSLFIDKYNELKKNIEKGKINSSQTFNMSNVMSNTNKTSSFSKLYVDKFYLQIKNSSQSSKNLKPPKLYSDDELENFQKNYTFMLAQNQEKDRLLKLKENEFKNLEISNENVLKENQNLKDDKNNLLNQIERFEMKLNEQINLNSENENTYKISIDKLNDENKKLLKEKNDFNLNFEKNLKDFDVLNLSNKEMGKQNSELKLENDNKDILIKRLENKIEQLNKELEQKIDEINYKNKSDENNYNDIINSRKEKDDLNNIIINLSKENSNFKENQKILIVNINNLKEGLTQLYEDTNKNFGLFEKKYNDRIIRMKQKLIKIYKVVNDIVIKYKNKIEELKKEILLKEKEILENNKNINKTDNINIPPIDPQLEIKYKQIIEKLQLEKTKLIYQLQNLERIIKENKTEKKKSQNNQNDQNSTTISILNAKVDWLQKEYTKFSQTTEPKYKEELEKEKENFKLLKKKINDLENKINQYKIENAGKSKIIDERNEEVRVLKEELIKLNNN